MANRYEGLTEQEWADYFVSVTAADVADQLIRRVDPEAVFEILEGQDGDTLYDRISMENKPELSVLEVEFPIWKAEKETIVANAFLRMDMIERVDVLRKEDIYRILSLSGVSVPNPELYLKMLIDTLDENGLISLEVSLDSVKILEAQEKAKKDKDEQDMDIFLAQVDVNDLKSEDINFVIKQIIQQWQG